MDDDTPTMDDLLRMMRDTRTRLDTQEAVALSMVNATDPDTPDGRRARLTLDTVREMMRRLDALAEDVLDARR